MSDEIDGIDEKIRSLTKQKEKKEREYKAMKALKKFDKLMNESADGLCNFNIICGCRENAHDKEHWTNIIINNDTRTKMTIPYPLCEGFDSELRELIRKYFK